MNNLFDKSSQIRDINRFKRTHPQQNFKDARDRIYRFTSVILKNSGIGWSFLSKEDTARIYRGNKAIEWNQSRNRIGPDDTKSGLIVVFYDENNPINHMYCQLWYRPFKDNLPYPRFNLPNDVYNLEESLGIINAMQLYHLTTYCGSVFMKPENIRCFWMCKYSDIPSDWWGIDSRYQHNKNKGKFDRIFIQQNKIQGNYSIIHPPNFNPIINIIKKAINN